MRGMAFDNKPTRRTLLRSITAGVTLGLGGLAASTSAAGSPQTFSLSELEARDDVRLQDIETEGDCTTTTMCLEKFCAPGYTYGSTMRCCGDTCEPIDSGCFCHS